MDMSFDVQTQGFFDFNFDSFMPENTEVFWKPKEVKTGESLALKGKDLGKKKVTETKNVAALKSHCEAERRRRERINGHLANLRTFVPSTDKMDKATLLAEVIRQVKELKFQALEATKGVLVPTDVDEVIVLPDNDHDGLDGVWQFKVFVCSDYKPEIIPNLRQSINDLKLTIVKAEISTLGNRVKNVFTVSGKKVDLRYSKKEKFAKSIHKAMSSVLEKISALEEYSPMAVYPSKRRRVSHLEASTSSPSL
ncbi:transcription factor bHLH30-like [Silene latifolia]|uniref:transcription factor bHLH30-like n=1 Tax=Silene latifolia TaxID=37657 RepID=UPI003D774079